MPGADFATHLDAPLKFQPRDWPVIVHTEISCIERATYLQGFAERIAGSVLTLGRVDSQRDSPRQT